jgi:DNA-binding transcriptional LysR family regulator
MTFDRRQLRAFLAVLEQGSLGRAAGLVNLSQPALSRLVQDMENRLGVRLFDRRRSGMTPTAYAEALAPHARLLLFEMGQAVDTLDALRGLRRGVLRVGAVGAVARGILPDAVAALLAKAPDLQVELMEAADDRLFAALAGRSIDLAIVGVEPDDPDLAPIGECEFNDQYSVICATDHDLGRTRPATVEAALQENWIMPPRGATPRAMFDALIREHGLPSPRVAIETTSPAAIVAFIARTRNLGWMPKPLFAEPEALGRVRELPLSEFRMGRRFVVYRRRQGLLAAPAAKLVEELPMRGRQRA